MDYSRIIFSTDDQLEQNNTHQPLIVTNCGYYIARNTKYSFFKPFSHRNEWLLIYLHKGRIRLPHKNNEIVEGGTILVFLPNEKLHCDFLEDEINERYYIYFKGTYLSTYMKQLLLNEPSGVHRIGESNTLISYFMEIMDDFKIHDFDTDIFRTTTLMRLLAHIHKKLPNGLNSFKEKEGLFPLVEYMEKNYADPLSLENYAKISNMSVPSLMRNFKKQFNTTPHAYLNNIRLTQAQNLLQTTNLSITEIAQQVGFIDPLYFCKFFKKQTQLSPSEYRRKFLHQV